MPGPGGGAHGGGGFGGGGFGGGRPGGFGGGFGGPPRGPRYGGFFPFGGWYHRPFFGGGGCLGGLLGVIFAPILVIVLFLSVFGGAFSSLLGGGMTVSSYDENTFQTYADTCYAEEFGNSTAYEDNILLVFLRDEECYNYYYIAWIGDHLEPDIRYLFGNNQTALGRAMQANVNQSSYLYSLDTNLAAVVSQMAAQIEAQSQDSSFICNENHVQVTSHLTNKTELPVTEEIVNKALHDFTDRTGIPMVIVVDDMVDVFGKPVSMGSSVMIILGVAAAFAAVVLVARKLGRKKGN